MGERWYSLRKRILAMKEARAKERVLRLKTRNTRRFLDEGLFRMSSFTEIRTRKDSLGWTLH